MSILFFLFREYRQQLVYLIRDTPKTQQKSKNYTVQVCKQTCQEIKKWKNDLGWNIFFSKIKRFSKQKGHVTQQRADLIDRNVFTLCEGVFWWVIWFFIAEAFALLRRCYWYFQEISVVPEHINGSWREMKFQGSLKRVNFPVMAVNEKSWKCQKILIVSY